MKEVNEIKGLVQTAMRMLDDGTWKPIDGGTWESSTGASVMFNKPTRFTGPWYSVICPRLGKWEGSLNGTTGRNIGKPRWTYTAEQVAENKALQARSSDEHAAEIAKALFN